MNKQKVGSALVEKSVVRVSFDPLFQWASGIKSPLYCDCRELIAMPAVRQLIVQEFVQTAPEVDYIVGTATAGIPWAAWVAAELQKPMLYVRSKPKEHGRNQLIEGRFESGKTALLVEDTISTGGSAKAAAAALEDAGIAVKEITCILSWKKSTDTFRSILDYAAVRSALAESGKCTAAELEQLDTFYENYLS